MNKVHQMICSSARWREELQQRLLPWALEGIELGPAVIEVGPGYGAATEVLSQRVEHLTAVEVDPELASGLRRRMAARNVTVLHEDATRTTLPGASFDGAVCFTMLHHVPSPHLQDRLLVEVFRMLKPGGLFVGSDSLDGRIFRMLHWFDTMVLVDPERLPTRLAEAGFQDITVERGVRAFRFRARKPLAA